MRNCAASWRVRAGGNTGLTVALVDLDHFKVYNDTYGHQAPDCSSGHARQILQRMCEAMPSGQTFSAGFASWDRKESVEGLVHRADAALYEVKAAGRNRFIEA